MATIGSINAEKTRRDAIENDIHTRLLILVGKIRADYDIFGADDELHDAKQKLMDVLTDRAIKRGRNAR